jgi:Holliday junction resolvase RusA-like endonuclease
MKIIIPGEPIAKARPRFFVSRGKKLAYNSQSGLESEIGYRIKSQLANAKYDHSANSYEIEFRFYFRPPPGKDANLKLWGIIEHTSRPDLDNICKMYMDASNGILYRDDAMVTKLSSSKHYSTNPRTEIDIMAKKIEHPAENLKKLMKAFTPDEFDEFVSDMKDVGDIYHPLKFKKDGWIRPAMPDDIIEFAKKYSKKLSEIAK